MNIQENSLFSFDLKQESTQHQDTNVLVKIKSSSFPSELPRDSLTITEQNRDGNVSALSTAKVSEVFRFKCHFNVFVFK